MATAYSPTAGRVPTNWATGSVLSVLTLMTARSVSGSRPTMVASSCSPVARVTLMVDTGLPVFSSVTTWLLVMIMPSER